MDARLTKRLGFGSLLVGLMALVLWVDTGLGLSWPVGVIVFVGLATVLGLREAVQLLQKAELPPPTPFTYQLGWALLILLPLPALTGASPLWRSAVLCAASLALTVAVLVAKDVESGLRRFAGGALALGLVVGLVALIELAAAHGTAVVFAVALTIKGGDIGGYLVGRACGRRKLIPHISPGKTMEGGLGGYAVSLGFGLLLFQGFGVGNLTVLETVGLALVLNTAGLLGDLLESVLKRAAGEKDSGQVLPEFGGALDMVDSLVLAAPIAVVGLALAG